MDFLLYRRHGQSCCQNVGEYYFCQGIDPYDLQEHLQEFLEKHKIDKRSFSEVIVVHRNNLFALVPQSLFDDSQLANYLKFNTKILANDHIVYDEIKNHDIFTVYVPFANINNYIFDLYGEFDFEHHSTVMIHSLLNASSNELDTIGYVHVGRQQMDITIISNKQLLLYNTFAFVTKEDFIYYLLFTLEQLKLNPEHISLKLFGAIEEDDEIYKLCHRYVKNVVISVPPVNTYPILESVEESIDFTLLSTL
ncbi:DUF3822 family protein [Maribacter halichondriae]|uniref:DUF3822 family protein n=1 Tax=Maribacter halichondriae TaxID=2980554 RepID=UPI002359B830|nr:DUF3822 family protein [Maribacter sp. Hal144]